MSDRNLKQELCYFNYIGMEDGNNIENIDYDCLIDLLKEILTRIEKLENKNA